MDHICSIFLIVVDFEMHFLNEIFEIVNFFIKKNDYAYSNK